MVRAAQLVDRGAMLASLPPRSRPLLSYVAPEIISQKPYSEQVDMWSIGVITYTLLCGRQPFYSENQVRAALAALLRDCAGCVTCGGQSVMFRQIRRGTYEFFSPTWDAVSDQAKDFVRRLLTVDPAHRMTWEDALKHEWLSGQVPDVELAEAREELKRFNARRRWKTGITTVRTTVRLQALIKPGKADAGPKVVSVNSVERSVASADPASP